MIDSLWITRMKERETALYLEVRAPARPLGGSGVRHDLRAASQSSALQGFVLKDAASQSSALQGLFGKAASRSSALQENAVRMEGRAPARPRRVKG
jgi:hypothetical protein